MRRRDFLWGVGGGAAVLSPQGRLLSMRDDPTLAPGLR
jgi:hypothetical protein